MGHLATTLSILSARTILRWWSKDPRELTQAFTAFAERLTGDFSFNNWDALADFADRAVTATKDNQIVRAAVRGLLGARCGQPTGTPLQITWNPDSQEYTYRNVETMMREQWPRIRRGSSRSWTRCTEASSQALRMAATTG
jgi:hypothetical protein